MAMAPMNHHLHHSKEAGLQGGKKHGNPHQSGNQPEGGMHLIRRAVTAITGNPGDRGDKNKVHIGAIPCASESD